MVELEEETYSKMVFILIAILVVVTFIFILDIITGGTLFQTILCMVVWAIPGVGRQMPGYVGCHAIPI